MKKLFVLLMLFTALLLCLNTAALCESYATETPTPITTTPTPIPPELCTQHDFHWSYVDRESGTHFSYCRICFTVEQHTGISYEYDSIYWHYMTCSKCDYYEAEHHVQLCSGPAGVCSLCGGAGEDMTFKHNAATVNYQSNNSYYHEVRCGACGQMLTTENHVEVYADQGDGTHAVTCAKCSYLIGTFDHSRNCDSNLCLYCGTVMDTEDDRYHVAHKRSSMYVDHGDGTHSQLCAVCGEPGYPDRHSHYCNENSCSYCAAPTDEKTYIYHDQRVYTDLGNGYHAYMCRVCGDYYSSYQHYRYCNEDAICCDCGAVDTDGTMVVYHSTRDNLYVPNADDKTHSTICSSCGIKINTANEHTRDCSATACTECGYDGPIDWVIHDYNYNQYVDFGDGTHGYVCSYCGDHAMYGLSKHHRSCISDEPVCTNCGSTDTRYITVHNLITVDNGDFTHSYLCSDCRYVIYTSIHYTSCNKYYCGACDARCDMDAPIIRYHSNSYAVPYDSDMHGMYCEDCGQIVAYYEHWYHCSDEIPTCAECDTVVDPEKAYRSHNVDIVDFGNGMHGYSCDDCGEITSAQYHYRYCYSILNECQDCNYRGDDLQVHHDAYLKSNGDGTHSYVCLDCGAIESTEPCYTLCSDQATGRCSACAAAGSFPVTHNFNEQGYTRCENCKYTLTASYLPANLTSIKPDAFNNTALQYVVIPNGCTEIGARAFANCENLVVKIPASVNSIAASAFSGCSNLRILCSVGSEALNYALAHNISYTIRN